METRTFFYLSIISKIAGNQIKVYDTKEEAEKVANMIHETFGNDIKTSIMEA